MKKKKTNEMNKIKKKMYFNRFCGLRFNFKSILKEINNKNTNICLYVMTQKGKDF